MAFSLKRIFILLSLGIVLILGGWLSYAGWYYHRLATGTPAYFVADTSVTGVSPSAQADSLYEAHWRRYLPSQFRIEDFIQPPQAMGPWTRWWWPGDRVDSLGLRRDLEMMQAMGFAGAEIYPTQAGIEKGVGEQERQAYLGYRTDSYYQHLAYSLEIADRLGLQLDMNVAAGGVQALDSLDRKEQLVSLAFAEADVLGGKRVELTLPQPDIPFSYWATAWEEEKLLDGNQNLLDWQTEHAELLAIWAARTEEEGRSDNPCNLADVISLDPDSIFEITPYASGGKLTWEAPGGFWKLIIAYQIPTGQGPAFLPTEKNYRVATPFDSAVNQKYLDLQLGSPALAKHIGKALRGVSWDHLQYLAEHPFPAGLLEAFQAEHGYDLRPFLPVLARPGIFFPKLEAWQIPTKSAYALQIGDERIRQDYLQTLTSLLVTNHLEISQAWARERGLLSRFQPYGLPLNHLQLAREAMIPEMEQAYAGSSRLFMKLIGASAPLHGKALISGEAGGQADLAFMDTPARLKREVDNLFLSGVNHLVWLGTPYRLADPDYGVTGWHPYSSPFYPQVNQGVNLSEGNPFWQQLESLQTYIARIQYVLRLGRPRPQTLVYYPFDAFPVDFPPKETHGGHGPDLPGPVQQGQAGEASRWLENVTPVLEEMDARGIAWTWVGLQDLEALAWKEGTLSLYDQSYTNLLLVEPPYMNVEAARNLYALYQEKAHIFLLGQKKMTHKGYLNWPKHDEEIEGLMQTMRYADASLPAGDMHNFWARFPRADRMSYAETYDFLTLESREDDQGKVYGFLVNQSASDRHVKLNLAPELTEAYWLNPMEGKAHRAIINEGGQVEAFFPSHASLLLIAGEAWSLTDSLLSPIDPVWKGQVPPNQASTLALEAWDFFLEDPAAQLSVRLVDTMLFDWKREAGLEYSRKDGLYATDFFLPQLQPQKRYLLDLGTFEGTLDIVINTDSVTTLLYPPYRLDITDWLQAGYNSLELWLTPPIHNYLLQQGLRDPEKYRQWEHPQRPLIRMGLTGPIQIWEVEP